MPDRIQNQHIENILVKFFTFGLDSLFLFKIASKLCITSRQKFEIKLQSSAILSKILKIR